MCSHSNKLKKHLLIALILQMNVLSLFAQSFINQTVQVMPPYTNKLSAYFEAPGKIMSVITTFNQMDASEYNYYIHGYIQLMDMDGTVRIGTRNSYVPARPKTMQALLGPDGGFIGWQPYTLTYSDYTEIFNPRNLEYSGISREEVERNGLPAGMYQICFVVYVKPSFSDTYSMQGPFCSQPFTIIPQMNEVEPPVIIQPYNNSLLTPEQMQTVQFSWTMPPGAPVTTQYKLKIIELDKDINVNYKDMLRNDSYPAFFETTVTGAPVYLYTIANPPLKEDKVYAFVVKAIDPFGNTKFKNSGFSEVSAFMQSTQTVMSQPTPPPPPPPSYGNYPDVQKVTPPMFKTTTIKGKLVYNSLLSGSKDKYPLTNAKIKLVINYIVKDKQGKLNIFPTNDSKHFCDNIDASFEPESKVVAVTQTNESGEFTFHFLSNYNGENLGRADCVRRGTAFLEQQPNNYLNNILAINKGPNANDYAASSDYCECDLFLGYKIIIDGAHAQYYLDPDDKEKYFVEINENETKDVGEIVVKPKTYILNIKTTAEGSKEKYTVHDNEELGLMNVWLYRKITMPVIGAPQIFPKDDGFPKDKIVFAPKFNGFVCVGRAETVVKTGIAKLSNLILTDNPAYQYYIFIDGKDKSFESDGLIWINLEEIIATSHTTYKERNFFNNKLESSLNAYLIKRSANNWENPEFPHTEKLTLRYPTLRVHITEDEGGKNINDYAQVVLTEKRSNGNTKQLQLAKIDSGLYELKKLSVELSSGKDKEVTGPQRSISVKVEGFSDFTADIPILKVGEKLTIEARMEYGAKLTGTVIDGISRKPIYGAKINIIGETANATNTDSKGKYEVDTRKLTTKRLVEITKPGYLPDTVEIYTNQAKNIYNFNLFPIARMLQVEIWAGSGWKEGAIVTLPGVLEDSKYEYKYENYHNIVNPVNLPADYYMPGGPASIPNIPDNLNITTGSVKEQLNSTAKRIEQSSKVDFSSLSFSNSFGSVTSSGKGIYNSIVIPEKKPYSQKTDSEGWACFWFTGGNNDKFRLVITNNPDDDDNFCTIITDIDIPYEKSVMGTRKRFTLPQGGCLAGTVSLENGTPLKDIKVEATVDYEGNKYTITSITDASGRYKLRNLPVKTPLSLSITPTKEGIIGYSEEKYILPKGGSDCNNQDFHLKQIIGVDVLSFMGFAFNNYGVERLPNGMIELSGKIIVDSNRGFSNGDVDIKKVLMKKTNSVNAKGDTILIPDKLPLILDDNEKDIRLFNTYNAILQDKSGIKIDLYDETKMLGEIKASVLINDDTKPQLNGNFGGFAYKLPNLWLTDKPSSQETLMAVYKGNIKDESENKSFYLTDGKNNNIVYSVNGFENKAHADPEKSVFNSGGLSLHTKFKADIKTIDPANFDIDAGVINISKNGIKVSNPKSFNVNMGKWVLKCNKWSINDKGLVVDDAILSTGMDVRIENLYFRHNELQTQYATVHLEKMKLLGVRDIIISTSKKGLVYKDFHNGVSGWALYANPDIGKTTVATLSDLPGLAPGDKIHFTSVDFNNQGENLLLLESRKFRLYDIVEFTPYPSTAMLVFSNAMKLKGVYDFGIPNYSKPSGAMAYHNEGGKLEFAMMDMDVFRFTHHGVIYDLSDKYQLSNSLFTAKGTIEEPGNLPKLKVTLSHKASGTKVDIDKGQKLDMGAGKELANLVGDIKVANNTWDVLRFQGEMKGFGDINPGQKLSFEVRGTVQAAGQEIMVSDIPSFPGLTMTYDMLNARLIGKASLDKNLAGIKVDGDITTILDSNGWLFIASGLAEIPALGGANMIGMFGNYKGLTPDVLKIIGSPLCLPMEFRKNMRGFYLSAGLTKQILPKIEHNYGIVAVSAGIDISLDARIYMLFGEGSTFGLGVLAEGRAYLGGSCGATCTSASASAGMQIGISGNYNTQSKIYNIDGCASLDLKISAKQCLPAFGVCGPCLSIDLLDLTIGATIHLDNKNGLSMGITRNSCNQQCN